MLACAATRFWAQAEWTGQWGEDVKAEEAASRRKVRGLAGAVFSEMKGLGITLPSRHVSRLADGRMVPLQNSCPEVVTNTLLKQAKEVYWRKLAKKHAVEELTRKPNRRLTAKHAAQARRGSTAELGRKRDCVACSGQPANTVSAVRQKVQRQHRLLPLLCMKGRKKPDVGCGEIQGVSRRARKPATNAKAVGHEVRCGLAGMGQESGRFPCAHRYGWLFERSLRAGYGLWLGGSAELDYDEEEEP